MRREAALAFSYDPWNIKLNMSATFTKGPGKGTIPVRHMSYRKTET